MKLILDTCVLLWMAGNPDKLSSSARKALAPSNEFYISAISAFEIAIKNKKKKLALPTDPWTWFQRVTGHFKMKEIPISARIAALAPDVDVPHGDPADRIILATAIENQLPLVSSDRLIQKCNQVEVIW
jgi:PIN domain nuclease of toxin-antitoxin system